MLSCYMTGKGIVVLKHRIVDGGEMTSEKMFSTSQISTFTCHCFLITNNQDRSIVYTLVLSILEGF